MSSQHVFPVDCRSALCERSAGTLSAAALAKVTFSDTDSVPTGVHRGDMIVSAALLLASAVLLVVWLLWDRRRRVAIALPGPRGLPVVGNALQIVGPGSHETLAAWSRRYGAAYRISVFGQPVVVLASAEKIREAFVERGRDFAGRPRPFFRAAFMADSYQARDYAARSDVAESAVTNDTIAILWV